jgi:hypothetical protein
MKQAILTITYLFVSLNLISQSATPKIYQTLFTSEQIVADGIANETAWQTAPWSDDFVDIEGDLKPLPEFRTRFKMLWDEEALYILAELEEPHIWATLENRDDIIFYDNDFEVFIDPDGDNHNYFELEVNAFGTEFDLYMNRPYNTGGNPLIGWDIAGLETAVHIDGTINNPADTDKKWQVEMAIPWKSIQIFAFEKRPPKTGETWRMNFSRVQWQTETKDGQYQKILDPETGKPFPEDNWVWSPQGVINMHLPEKWGYILFVDEFSDMKISVEQLDPDYQTKEILLDLYEQQKSFFKEHKRYATSLFELNKQGRQSATDIFIEATSKQYIISSRQKNGDIIYIDHNKRLWKE